jgi:hypothetical protein
MMLEDKVSLVAVAVADIDEDAGSLRSLRLPRADDPEARCGFKGKSPREISPEAGKRKKLSPLQKPTLNSVSPLFSEGLWRYGSFTGRAGGPRQGEFPTQPDPVDPDTPPDRHHDRSAARCPP